MVYIRLRKSKNSFDYEKNEIFPAAHFAADFWDDARAILCAFQTKMRLSALVKIDEINFLGKNGAVFSWLRFLFFNKIEVKRKENQLQITSATTKILPITTTKSSGSDALRAARRAFFTDENALPRKPNSTDFSFKIFASKPRGMFAFAK